MQIQQLEDNLEQLPQLIRDQEMKVIFAKDKLEQAKLSYEVKLAFETVAAEGENATVKKAKAVVKATPEKRVMLETNLAYERQNAEFNYLTNQWIGVRKLASLMEKTHSPESSGF